MVTLRCTCGETYQADDAHVGKSIRCRCGRILDITAAPVLASASGPWTPSRAQEVLEPRAAGRTAPQRRRGWRVPAAVLATLLAAVLVLLWAGAGVEPMSRLSSPAGTVVRPDVDPVEALARVRQTLPVAAASDPRCEPENVDRPGSSDELGGSYRGGISRLRIVNGTDDDAVAVLVEPPPGLPRRAIYIRAGETGFITEVPPGNYRLQFQLGSSWLGAGTGFCKIRGTSEFDRSLLFEEGDAGFEITLHPVLGGTATTHSIPASAFRLPP